MCYWLEFSRHTKKARNKLTYCRCILNVIGILTVLALGVLAALFATYSSEWFPERPGYDSLYLRISKGDKNVFTLTNDRMEDCANKNASKLMLDRVVYWCANKNCIPMDNRCDGFDDCDDNSDEEAINDVSCKNFCESASSARFMCAVRNLNNVTLKYVTKESCMHIYYRCDGEIDCTGEPANVNDESSCKDVYNVGATGIQCSLSNDWICKDGKSCTRTSKVCNGLEDCGDGSDERKC